MKKFKLIKTYPGSPPLGVTVVKSLPLRGQYVSSDGLGFEDIRTVENFPEFWEEVKDYKILLKCHGEIQAVKRLSDGFTFTVGDFIGNSLEVIRSIVLIEDKIRIYPMFSFYFLDECPVPREVIGKDYHGINIYKRDVCYAVNKASFSLNTAKGESPVGNNYHVFASKELAEDFIMLNKPTLSLQEVKYFISGDLVELTKLVKSRI